MAGEAAIGVVLKAPLEEISERIDPAKDHHVADYRTLIRGLEAARSRGIGDARWLPADEERCQASSIGEEESVAGDRLVAEEPGGRLCRF